MLDRASDFGPGRAQKVDSLECGDEPGDVVVFLDELQHPFGEGVIGVGVEKSDAWCRVAGHESRHVLGKKSASRDRGIQ